MARTITVAALQTSYGEDMAANIRKTEGLIREAAARGAQATPASRFGTPASASSVSASAGTSGTRKKPAPWP